MFSPTPATWYLASVTWIFLGLRAWAFLAPALPGLGRSAYFALWTAHICFPVSAPFVGNCCLLLSLLFFKFSWLSFYSFILILLSCGQGQRFMHGLNLQDLTRSQVVFKKWDWVYMMHKFYFISEKICWALYFACENNLKSNFSLCILYIYCLLET